MFYGDEIRDFDAIPKGNHERLTPGEFELATRLLEKLSSDDFEPEAYTDEHRARVLAKLDEKKKGREITVRRPAPPRAGVVDLYEALKRSLQESQPAKSNANGRTRKKA